MNDLKTIYEAIHKKYKDLISALTGKENSNNKVTEISSESTDTEYPSAKAVYDSIQQSDWNQTNNIAADYIKNKPIVKITDSDLDVPLSSEKVSEIKSCLGLDTRDVQNFMDFAPIESVALTTVGIINYDGDSIAEYFLQDRECIERVFGDAYNLTFGMTDFNLIALISNENVYTLRLLRCFNNGTT